MRPVDEAMSAGGLKTIGSDISVLRLDPDITLVSTLLLVQQAGEIALLRRTNPQIVPERSRQHAPELSLLGPITIELVDPFVFVGLDVSTATEHLVREAYHPLIERLSLVLEESPQGSHARKIADQFLAHVKKSYWFAVMLVVMKRVNSQRVQHILAMNPGDLYVEREREIGVENQRRMQHQGNKFSSVS